MHIFSFHQAIAILPTAGGAVPSVACSTVLMITSGAVITNANNATLLIAGDAVAKVAGPQFLLRGSLTAEASCL